MTELPNGWATATFEELSGLGGLVSDGDWIESKDQDPNGTIRLIQLMDIGDGVFRDRSRRFVNDETAQRLNCTRLKEGDLLIARMPDPLGRACIFPGVGQDAITAVDVLIWRGGEGSADPRWLRGAINAPETREKIGLQAGGTTRQRIAGGRLKVLELPVPPLAEQRRIVAKLDALTARTARARADLDRIPTLAARYKQAVLTAAFNDLADTKNLKRVTVDEIADGVFDGPFGSNLKSDDYVDFGVRVIRLENIGHLSFIENKRTYISEAKFAELVRHELKPGDVLFSSFVAEQVRVCVLPQLDTPAINKADCFCIRSDGKICNSRYLAYRLACRETYVQFEAQVHGATRPRINLRQLKSFEFELPPLDVQFSTVGRIERAFAEIDRLAAEAAFARKLLDGLDQALLAKAFRGGLVPQDPTDEPASAVLARIKQEREAEGVKPKSRRGRGPNGPEGQAMIEKALSPRERILKDSESWPALGLPFESVAARNAMPYEELRSSIFELLTGPSPALQQWFDADAELMLIRRVTA